MKEILCKPADRPAVIAGAGIRDLWRRRVIARSHDARGFTAIEIAMVATVIAILSLIVLPLFRNRVEEAKLAAAKADLESLLKAEILAQADTSFYFRLEDLDNVLNNDPVAPPVAGITVEVPPLVYAEGQTQNPRGLTQTEWHNLAGTKASPKFKGPYTAFTRTIPYGELLLTGTPMLRSVNGNTYSAIRDLRQGNLPAGSDAQLFDSPDNRMPIDPWGQPYLFFPPGTESAYNFSVIYSMGPDGLPGDAGAATQNNYLRETGVLGTGDDLEVRF
jgi:type II secretory pathway pseudopilin PulG